MISLISGDGVIIIIIYNCGNTVFLWKLFKNWGKKGI